jgi:Putative transmembrane protein (Alph_Pro_TM)
MIYSLAFSYPFLYGLLAVAIAIVAGLIGWLAFRRE